MKKKIDQYVESGWVVADLPAAGTVCDFTLVNESNYTQYAGVRKYGSDQHRVIELKPGEEVHIQEETDLKGRVESYSETKAVKIYLTGYWEEGILKEEL